VALATATAGAIASAWEQLDERARAYAEAARAPATLRAYAADWHLFTAWCAAHGVDALPATPHTVALFLADLNGRPSTLRRKLAAIAVMHRAAGHDSPTEHGVVRATFAGIRRERGVAPRPKTALLVELRAAVATCGERRIDVRDRALVLVGFAGALRRSELVGLDVADVGFETAGIVLRLRRSKRTRKASSRKSPCCTALTRTPAPCGRYRPGSRAARSPRGRCSARSIAPDASAVDVSPRASSASGGRRSAHGAASIRKVTRRTRCAAGLRRQPPARTNRKPRLCAKGAGRASRSRAATSAPGRVGTTTPARVSDFKPVRL